MPVLSGAFTEPHTTVLDRDIFVFDGRGRLSINRVKLSTACNAVAKMRARWVGPDAIQHNEIFDDLKVTFNPGRYFPGEKIVINDQDSLTGKEALETWYIIDLHNIRPYKIKINEDLTWSARRVAAALAQIKNDGQLDRAIDRTIIGAVYALGDHPIVTPSIKNIANICQSIDFYINLSDLVLPQARAVKASLKFVEKIKKGYVPEPIAVRLDDGILKMYKGKGKIDWRFRVVRGLGTVLAQKETGAEKARCRIVGNCNDMVFAKLHELRSLGLIVMVYGRPVLSEPMIRLVRRLNLKVN